MEKSIHSQSATILASHRPGRSLAIALESADYSNNPSGHGTIRSRCVSRIELKSKLVAHSNGDEGEGIVGYHMRTRTADSVATLFDTRISHRERTGIEVRSKRRCSPFFVLSLSLGY